MSCSMLALNAPMLTSVESLNPRYSVSIRPSTLGVGVGIRCPNRGGFGRLKVSAAYDTDGNITNRFGAKVRLNKYHDYHGHQDPLKPYPLEIENGQTKGFRQLADDTNTSSGGLSYRAQDEQKKDVNVIFAWTNSSQAKKVYTEIDDPTKEINWDQIESALYSSGDSYKTTSRGLTSSIKWIYGDDPHIEVSFTIAS